MHFIKNLPYDSKYRAGDSECIYFLICRVAISVKDILSLGTINVLCIIAFAASKEVKHEVPLSTAILRSLKPSRSGILPWVGVLIIS